MYSKKSIENIVNGLKRSRLTRNDASWLKIMVQNADSMGNIPDYHHKPPSTVIIKKMLNLAQSYCHKRWDSDLMELPEKIHFLIDLLNQALKERCEAGYNEIRLYSHLIDYVKRFRRYPEIQEDLSKNRIDCIRPKVKAAILENDPKELFILLTKNAELWEIEPLLESSLNPMGTKIAKRALENLLDFMCDGGIKTSSHKARTVEVFTYAAVMLGLDPLNVAVSKRVDKIFLWKDFLISAIDSGDYAYALDILDSATKVFHLCDFTNSKQLYKKVNYVLDRSRMLADRDSPDLKQKDALVYWRFKPDPYGLNTVLDVIIGSGGNVYMWSKNELDFITDFTAGCDDRSFMNAMNILRVISGDFQGFIKFLSDSTGLSFSDLGLFFIGLTAATEIQWEDDWMIGEFITLFRNTFIYHHAYFSRYDESKYTIEPVIKAVLKHYPPNQMFLKKGLAIMHNRALENVKTVTTEKQRDSYKHAASLAVAVMEGWILTGEFGRAQRMEEQILSEFRRFPALIRKFHAAQKTSSMFGDKSEE